MLNLGWQQECCEEINSNLPSCVQPHMVIILRYTGVFHAQFLQLFFISDKTVDTSGISELVTTLHQQLIISFYFPPQHAQCWRVNGSSMWIDNSQLPGHYQSFLGTESNPKSLINFLKLHFTAHCFVQLDSRGKLSRITIFQWPAFACKTCLLFSMETSANNLRI